MIGDAGSGDVDGTRSLGQSASMRASVVIVAHRHAPGFSGRKSLLGIPNQHNQRMRDSPGRQGDGLARTKSFRYSDGRRRPQRIFVRSYGRIQLGHPACINRPHSRRHHTPCHLASQPHASGMVFDYPAVRTVVF